MRLDDAIVTIQLVLEVCGAKGGSDRYCIADRAIDLDR